MSNALNEFPPVIKKRYSFFSTTMGKVIRDKHLLILLALPIVYYLVFMYGPMFGVIIAFKKFNAAKGFFGSPWVGLKYFEKFIDDPFFWQAVKNTFVLGFLSILFGMPASIILALILNEVSSNVFKRFAQTVTYLPHFISVVVVCGIVFNFVASDGLINKLIEMLGGKRIQFLSKTIWFPPVFVISEVWQTAGWGSILYLAAIAGINPELYEAAMADGAGRFRKIWYITLPCLLPTISILLILRIGRVLRLSFQKVLLLYSPAVYETADVIQTYVYRRGLLGAQFSYGTAIGLFQSVVGLVLLIGANTASKKLSETSLW